ncbi:hypothetical protein OXPF_13160 [Oxobacter pfennigii]|uniref:Uncharacterized protein n=1 Tax=Oxobacter pfennigii TaxID=36849 RepID=A0A0P8X205_9CLOT|nr:hypothetical protein [Oxobacter pfennigii]KPU44841.1 hypothetical protein OXPF_13160 [Oxobacter pfennigii]
MYIILAFLFAFVLGYGLGRRRGKSQGIMLGLSYAPFEIRMESLKNNKCSICGDTINCDNSVSVIE